MPEYNLTFLKRSKKTTDDLIFQAIISAGITYYKCFAIKLNGEEKVYVKDFKEAETVINKLKEQNSNNAKSLQILEKYSKVQETITSVDESVKKLYEKKVEEPVDTNEGGSNKSTYIASLGVSFIEPVQGMISSRFGIRRRDNHKGLDIANSVGTKIKAAASGTVEYARYNSGGYGNLVIISHGNGVQTYYGHCSKIFVSEGQQVKQGDVISAMGSTGISTGSHLHWEVRVNGVAQNPQNYIYKGR